MFTRQQSFGYRFGMLQRLSASLVRDKMRQLGIQPSQVPFMAALLTDEQPQTQDELAARFVIDRSAAARALEQLEIAGFVERRINPDNRRQKLVTATAKARGIAGDFFHILRSASEVFVKDFSEDERQAAMRFLDRMLANAVEEKYDRRG